MGEASKTENTITKIVTRSNARITGVENIAAIAAME
jgi:hypothetical protein